MAQERRSSTLPSKSIKAIDVLLVGLLTYASSDSSCLPRKCSRWHIVALILALTVAGQWRIFTALPIYQECGILYAAELSLSMHLWKAFG
jgi:hypothetical protein